jgi:hypothetical protein
VLHMISAACGAAIITMRTARRSTVCVSVYIKCVNAREQHEKDAAKVVVPGLSAEGIMRSLLVCDIVRHPKARCHDDSH